jgi:hypothetical protein
LLHAAFILLAMRRAPFLRLRFIEHIAHGLAVVAYAAFVAGLGCANVVLLSFLVPVRLVIYVGLFVVFHKKVFCSVTKSKPMASGLVYQSGNLLTGLIKAALSLLLPITTVAPIR